MNLSLPTTKRVRSLSPNKHPYHQLKKWGRFGYKNHAMDTDRFNNRNTNIYSAFHYDTLALNKSPQLDSNFNKLLYKKQIESLQRSDFPVKSILFSKRVASTNSRLRGD